MLRSTETRPLSTMTPPRELPCPPMYLVSELITISAPHWIGLIRSGRGDSIVDDQWHTVFVRHVAASASISMMLPAGLPMVSQNTAVVLSSMSSLNGSLPNRPAANRTSMPSFGSMCLNRV